MGYAERNNTHERNGDAPPGSPPLERHARWCEAPNSDFAPCTCRPIPALRCDTCGKVFEPLPDETPIQFSERVQLHASVHPDHVTMFTKGTTTRTPRPPSP